MLLHNHPSAPHIENSGTTNTSPRPLPVITFLPKEITTLISSTLQYFLRFDIHVNGYHKQSCWGYVYTSFGYSTKSKSVASLLELVAERW